MWLTWKLFGVALSKHRAHERHRHPFTPQVIAQPQAVVANQTSSTTAVKQQLNRKYPAFDERSYCWQIDGSKRLHCVMWYINLPFRKRLEAFLKLWEGLEVWGTCCRTDVHHGVGWKPYSDLIKFKCLQCTGCEKSLLLHITIRLLPSHHQIQQGTWKTQINSTIAQKRRKLWNKSK